jgi:hypothetical protein
MLLQQASSIPQAGSSVTFSQLDVRALKSHDAIENEVLGACTLLHRIFAPCLCTAIHVTRQAHEDFLAWRAFKLKDTYTHPQHA